MTLLCFNGISRRVKAVSRLLADAANAENGALAPVLNQLNSGQLHAVLLAYIPVRFGHLFTTNVMAVDMFLTTFIVTAVIAALTIVAKMVKAVLGASTSSSGEDLTVKVDYYTVDQYSERYPNPHWSALAWLASRSAKASSDGAYRMVVTNETVQDEWPRLSELLGVSDEPQIHAIEDELNDVTGFNILPRDSSKIRFEADGWLFDVWFDQKNETDEGDKKSSNSTYQVPSEPSLVVQRIAASSSPAFPAPATVEWITAWLLRVSRLHKAHILSSRRRGRWEIRNDGGFWCRTRDLHAARGLDAVALDKGQGEMLKRDLERFIADRSFYSKIGMPYRRGYLFSGRPGTGKTSLVQAISATYGRDIYYMNLKNIKEDSALQSAFSNVPRNSIIVLEDVDAQSKIVHTRSDSSSPSVHRHIRPKSPSRKLFEDEDNIDSDSDTDSPPDKPLKIGPTKKGSGLSDFFGPTLSCLLNCLDGYAMAEGTIVILTSNHPERLDPALIRPGRIDLHLELGYCTHFQLRAMYKTVVGIDSLDNKDKCEEQARDDESETTEFPPELDLEGIPEHVLAPCDAMRIMVLYRDKPWEISGKLRARCVELKEGKGVGDAMSFDVEEEVEVESDGGDELDAEEEQRKSETESVASQW